MKRLELDQAISILANLGVIAGIVFLGVELRQNNDQLRSQSRANIYEMQAEIQRNYFRNDGGMADLYVKANTDGAVLTAVEATRLASYQTHLLRTMEFIFREDPDGAVDSIRWMRTLFRSTPGMTDEWESIKSNRDPDFVEFLEAQVISQL